jgi:hypothetical protein
VEQTGPGFYREDLEELLKTMAEEITPLVTFAPIGRQTLAEITVDGVVRIDWPAVDQAAADPANRVHELAVMMLAIRDGTWRAL